MSHERTDGDLRNTGLSPSTTASGITNSTDRRGRRERDAEKLRSFTEG